MNNNTEPSTADKANHILTIGGCFVQRNRQTVPGESFSLTSPSSWIRG